jgi:hypothetical protein
LNNAKPAKKKEIKMKMPKNKKNKGDGSSVYLLCAYNMIHGIFGYLLSYSYTKRRFYRGINLNNHIKIRQNLPADIESGGCLLVDTQMELFARRYSGLCYFFP